MVQSRYLERRGGIHLGFPEPAPEAPHLLGPHPRGLCVPNIPSLRAEASERESRTRSAPHTPTWRDHSEHICGPSNSYMEARLRLVPLIPGTTGE